VSMEALRELNRRPPAFWCLAVIRKGSLAGRSSAKAVALAAYFEGPLSSESGPLTEPRQTPNRRPFLDI
jgi:hypothetical protein